jgi:heat shock protein HtpX
VEFFSRIIAFLVDNAGSSDRDENRGPGIAYFVTHFVCQIAFGLVASMIVAWFSRQREFRADAGSAKLLGNRQPMINALARLGGMQAGGLPGSMAAAGINDKAGWAEMFSSHPPMEQRIAALQQLH